VATLAEALQPEEGKQVEEGRQVEEDKQVEVDRQVEADQHLVAPRNGVNVVERAGLAQPPAHLRIPASIQTHGIASVYDMVRMRSWKERGEVWLSELGR